jgi:hypothetical protein
MVAANIETQDVLPGRKPLRAEIEDVAAACPVAR